ncbi:AI-2E family transporter [Hyphomicrobium sp. LHD-15]|uniref:AI-2E family transporter n=1 Tax=Hyphomicrobium sp. LHD-15 TaxID=3072142 RepID=UPI00280F2595|nr:AI-2E family transporter [Hyphomicrobium sp. LHD-15]MDQ8699215.1 AI-2E family transporter [Hyphomicrobium sp. LHD-15]
MTDWMFVQRALTVFAIGVLALLLWKLSNLLLLIFASALCAIALRAMMKPLTGATGMPEPVAIAVALSLIVFFLTGIVFQFGGRLAEQTEYLLDAAPAALRTLTQDLNLEALSQSVGGSALGEFASQAVALGSSVLSALASSVLIIVGGIYLAAAPDTYRRGFVALVPKHWQSVMSSTLEDCGFALSQWLRAQLIAMCLIGVMTGVGMWLVGVPSPLALGLIAGAFEFIPYIGPIIGAIPALLLASAVSWDVTVAALIVAVIIQQFENNIIMPLLVGRVVELPAAVGLFATVAMGIVFGPLGLLLGYPLSIVGDVAVRRLYVRETLGKSVDIPAERERRQSSD